jgi:hypothetical protein
MEENWINKRNDDNKTWFRKICYYKKHRYNKMIEKNNWIDDIIYLKKYINNFIFIKDERELFHKWPIHK